MTKCRIDGCERPAKWRGMCSAHYQQWVKRNRPGGYGNHPVTRHVALVAPFGGMRPFCRAVGVDPKTVHRWPEGAVPIQRHAEILAGAERAGVDAAVVRRALEGPL